MRAHVVGRSVVVAVVVLGLFAGSAVAAPGFELVGSFGNSGSGSGGSGSGPGELHDPQHVALRVSSGELFVADRVNDRVQVFDSASGAVLGEFGDASSMDGPFGVAVDQASGDVYVASQGSNEVSKWSDAGLGYVQDVLFTGPVLGADPSLPQAGELFSFMAALAVDPVTGDLLVATTDPNWQGNPVAQLVHRFDSSGGFVSSFDGAAAPGGGFFEIRDLAVDATGDVYVADAGDGGRVLRFDPDGTPDAGIAVYEKVGSPSRVAVDPSGAVVVAVNANDPCNLDRVVSFDGATAQSETVVPPSAPDCTIPTGLAFDATGELLVATADWCGEGSPCGGQTAIHRFALTGQTATVTADPATGVSDTTATLTGTVNPEGAPSIYWFETSTDGINYNPTATKGPIDGAGDVAVSQAVTGLAEATQHWYRLVARRGDILVRSTALSFTTVDIEAPAVTLEPVGDLSESGATLRATVDSNGSQTVYHFEYSPDGGSSWFWLPGPDGDPNTQDEHQLGNVLDQPTQVSEFLSGLSPGTSYLTRIVATNSGGTGQVDGTFDTPTVPAVVSGVQAHGVSATGAVVTGTVNPRNAPTSYHVDYGPDAGYGNTTPTMSLPAGMADEAVTFALEGLDPSTEYHYRLVADNGTGGPQDSGDQTFTTADPQPTVAGAPSVSVGGDGSVALSGTVNAQGVTGGSYSFSIQSTNSPYSHATPTTQLSTANGPVAVTATATGLPAGEVFRARVRVTTAAGTATSDWAQFATAPPATYVPPGSVPTTQTPYGCANPRLTSRKATARPGQTIRITGTDLGTSATVALGGNRIHPTTYTASGFKIAIPQDTRPGTLPLTVNCGQASNTIQIKIVKPQANKLTIKTRAQGPKAIVTIRIPAPGRVTIRSTHTKTKTLRASKPGPLKTTVALNRQARQKLANNGRLTVALAITYTSTTGNQTAKKRRLTLTTRKDHR